MDAVLRVPDGLRPHVRRQIRGFYVGLVAYSLVVGAALVGLLGVTAGGPVLGGLVGSTLAERWRWWRRREHYLTEIEARAALRTGADPPPELLPAVRREARQVIHELPVVVGALCVVSVVLALACAVAAALRDDVLVGLPAAPCVAFAAWALVRGRSARTGAQRWLAAHPPPRREEPA
ncbi:MAG: hypothetical protein DI571_14250 [Arsenicicoccus sp.]|nr:MAG: hypothetical protein DI571_14250 [Arsenicicoccus sp.]